MHFFFRLFGMLPLPVNHAIGWCLGWVAWVAGARHRRIVQDNLVRYAAWKRLSPAGAGALTRMAIAEQGKGLTELAIAWTAPLARLKRLVRAERGWGAVAAAKTAGRPVAFVSPHLGCFDIAGRYVTTRLPITALYRPPKQAWLAPIMEAGRGRGGATTAPADGAGVRALLKTLKSGGNVMILPDQVPAAEKGGEGVWAPFLGAPAYTMTLLPRLAQSTGAAVFYFFAERLSWGRGYVVHFVPLAASYGDDKTEAARTTNAMVETLIDLAPAQYLWSYNRFKRPAGAPERPVA